VPVTLNGGVPSVAAAAAVGHGTNGTNEMSFKIFIQHVFQHICQPLCLVLIPPCHVLSISCRSLGEGAGAVAGSERGAGGEVAAQTTDRPSCCGCGFRSERRG